MKLFNLIFILFLGYTAGAQTLDEELGFIYVKADYLLETNRYDEAIAEFSKIIDKDATFRDALYKRADAKFNVGAFQGTRNDLLKMFEVKGITPESVVLYSKAAKNLGNTEIAEVTQETAEMLYPDGTSPRSKTRASKERDTDSGSQSSDDKLKDEVKRIEDKISSILDDLLPKDDDEKEDESTDDDDDDDDDESSTSRGGNDSGRESAERSSDDSGSRTTTDRKRESTKEVEEEEIVEEPKEDNSVNEIYIDEDVSLEIKNGLGARKVLDQPSILILSESSGSVVIDLCVNENGKVTQAEYNKGESTLITQSIISLAVRKAKEFWFKSSTAEEMCGTIVFKITGS